MDLLSKNIIALAKSFGRNQKFTISLLID